MKKLFVNIRQGKLENVKAILKKSPELINCASGALPKKDHGQSPLQVALKTGHLNIATYLIENGADVNFMEAEDDDKGVRAPVLFDAIIATIDSLCYEQIDSSETALKLVQLMIEKGADVNKTDSLGRSAMLWAVFRARNIFEHPSAYPHVQDKARSQFTCIFDLLIANGADPIAWANSTPYPFSSTNKQQYIDEIPPGNDINRYTRQVLREYFLRKNLL